jgi:hypothetical protein
MRAFARVFLFLAFTAWLAASASAQTANSVNIFYDFAGPQQEIASVSQVEVTQIPTNVVVNGKIISQFFPIFTRANTPSLTNGLFTLTNVIKGVVYRTTFTYRGNPHTDYIFADTNAADGATIGAWTNIVWPTNGGFTGLFPQYLEKVPGATVGYVATATDALGHYTWLPGGGGGGGGSGNVTGPGSSQAHHVAGFANTSGQLLEDAGFTEASVLPWATWNTNAFGTAAFKPTGFFDLANAGTTAATAATNGYPWGALYDALNTALNATNGMGLPSQLAAFRNTNTFDVAGAATAATNGYPWGALYDALNAALNATNGMGLPSGLAAFRNTNSLAPTNVATASKVGLVKVDGSTITVAADGTIAATTGGGGNVTGSGASTTGNLPSINNGTTTAIVDSGVPVGSIAQTNDSRSLKFTNTANKIWGSFNGISRETNTIAVSGVHGLSIGENTDNSFLTGGSPGAELLQQRLAYTGWWGIDPNNIATLWKVGTSESSTIPDMAWNFLGPATSTYSDTAHVAKGAPTTLSAPYISGSASSMIDLPTHGPEVWAAKKHPWIGVNTAFVGQSIGNWRTFEITYTNLPNVARWLNTNGTVAQLAQYGIQVGIWGDTGAFTNRTAGGALQFDPWILTASGFSNESNYVYAIHTNGVKLSLANYRSTYIANPFNGDTQRVQTNGTSTDIGFPSGLAGWTGPAWAVITPETIEKDMLWYYSNRVDEVFVQDANQFEMFAGYEQQVYKFAYSALYLGPGTHLYWADNNGLSGQNPIGAGPYSYPRPAPQYTNQMILGWFADFPSSQLQYSINDMSINQGFTPVGSEPGMAQEMSYMRMYNESLSNWDNPVFPVMPESVDANDQSLSKTSLTNILAIGEMNSGNIFFEVDTNNWSWNTNVQQVLTNAPIYLSTWNDNLFKKPLRMFDDGTNSLWIRPIDNGAFLVLAAAQGAASSNFNYTLCAPLKGIATNVVYTATNVLSGTAYGSGYLTNNFIGTVTTNAVVYIRLTPALPQTRVFNYSGSTVGTTNRPDGGIDYGISVAAGGTVTSVALSAPAEFTISGSPVTTSGTLGVTRTAGATANFVGQNTTNIANIAATNSLITGGPFIDGTNVFQVDTLAGPRKFMVTTNGDVFINGQKVLAVSGTPTSVYAGFDSSGNIRGTNDGVGWTNITHYTHLGTSTNNTITFNNTQQYFTATNGGTQFWHFAGSGGSAVIQIPTNITLHFDYTLTGWLGGTSNTVVTNGALVVTSMGGTNDSQLLEAIVEK